MGDRASQRAWSPLPQRVLQAWPPVFVCSAVFIYLSGESTQSQIPKLAMSLREREEGRKEEGKGERREGCVRERERDRVGRNEKGSRYLLCLILPIYFLIVRKGLDMRLDNQKTCSSVAL